MITFHQSTGVIDKDGVVIGKGWAGNHAGKNNPDMQSVKGIGPLPVGLYTIGLPADHPESVGRFAMALVPDSANIMFGRSGFYIHGSDQDPHKFGQESDGCIVAMRPIRGTINSDTDRRLRVVA